MPPALTLRIVIEQPPAGVDFALQKASGQADSCWSRRMKIPLEGPNFATVKEFEGWAPGAGK